MNKIVLVVLILGSFTCFGQAKVTSGFLRWSLTNKEQNTLYIKLMKTYDSMVFNCSQKEIEYKDIIKKDKQDSTIFKQILIKRDSIDLNLKDTIKQQNKKINTKNVFGILKDIAIGGLMAIIIILSLQ